MLISNIEWMAIERGLKKGLQQGREQGIEQGREQGLQQGREEGREEGRQEGREKGREEALTAIVARLLSHKFGELSQRIQVQIKRLSVKQLEELGEALLDFEEIKDVREWLNNHPPQNGHKAKAKSATKKKLRA